MILTNCRLVPELSGGVGGACCTVEAENGRITRVAAARSDAPGAVDCGGKTLLPGLIDLHTHITMLGGVGADKLRSPMGLLAAAAENARHYLDRGFTTIRDCSGPSRAANFVRDMVRAGTLEAPDILSCGLGLCSTVYSQLGDDSANLATADGPEQCRAAVRREVAEGADFIKVFSSGSAMDSLYATQHAFYDEDELRAVVSAAEARGRYVAVHCHDDESIERCIRCGVRTIEHATYLSEQSLALLLEKGDTCFLVPTLAPMTTFQSDPEKQAAWDAILLPMLDRCVENIRRAYEAGVILGFGTDSAPLSEQYARGVEFLLRRDRCGMKDLDILLQATKYNAHIAGIGNEVGEITAGRKADLLLVEGHPDEDIAALCRRPAAVWKGGRPVREEN